MVALLAGFGASDAVAAGVGSLATSTGLLATLLTVFAMKGWPALGAVAPTAGGVLIVVAALAWVLPGRPGPVRAGFRAWRTSLARRAGGDGPERGGALAGTASALHAHGIDPEALRAELVTLFRQVQSAWDRAELTALRDITTPELLQELVAEQARCLPQTGPSRTQIVAVEAELCAYEAFQDDEVVTVAFSGSLREGAGDAALPFREVWLLMRSRAPESPWKLARHQTLY